MAHEENILNHKVIYFIRTFPIYSILETSFNKAGKNKGERKREQNLLRGRKDSENVNRKRNLGETNFYQFFQASGPI